MSDHTALLIQRLRQMQRDALVNSRLGWSEGFREAADALEAADITIRKKDEELERLARINTENARRVLDRDDQLAAERQRREEADTTIRELREQRPLALDQAIAESKLLISQAITHEAELRQALQRLSTALETLRNPAGPPRAIAWPV